LPRYGVGCLSHGGKELPIRANARDAQQSEEFFLKAAAMRREIIQNGLHGDGQIRGK
jgi:hypothetical protein